MQDFVPFLVGFDLASKDYRVDPDLLYAIRYPFPADLCHLFQVHHPYRHLELVLAQIHCFSRDLIQHLDYQLVHLFYHVKMVDHLFCYLDLLQLHVVYLESRPLILTNDTIKLQF